MEHWNEQYRVANGIRLHFWRTGGDKPPLVLSHGITDNGLCWTRVARALEADYDIIMVDARGHGQSDKPEAGYTTDDHADDLAALIEALALDRPLVMGHSMGASTASTLAYKRPDLVSRIVLEDPPWREMPVEMAAANRQHMDEWRASAAAQQKQTAEAIIAQGRSEHPAWDDVEFGPWSRAKQQHSLYVFDFGERRPNQWQKIAADLTVPTLLVTADPEAGAIVTPEIAQSLAAENANITVAQIAGAGHNIRREQFDAFLNGVRPFLAG